MDISSLVVRDGAAHGPGRTILERAIREAFKTDDPLLAARVMIEAPLAVSSLEKLVRVTADFDPFDEAPLAAANTFLARAIGFRELEAAAMDAFKSGELDLPWQWFRLLPPEDAFDCYLSAIRVCDSGSRAISVAAMGLVDMEGEIFCHLDMARQVAEFPFSDEVKSNDDLWAHQLQPLVEKCAAAAEKWKAVAPS